MRAITINSALVLLLALSGSAQIRHGRLRLRPQPVEAEEEQGGIQYAYNADDRSSGDQVVLVSSRDYNGLYGQPARSRADDDYSPPARSQPQPQRPLRTKEQSKAPPVQTIRNYNKVNDDGSFTFGYEAADGSFKEETRGTDCVVRGKYGYVDPDGNKREFTYVSGNPCDPNAPDEEEEPAGDINDNEPANYPSRPPIRQRPQPTTQRAPTTFFQNNFRQQDEEVEEEPEEEPLQQIHQRIVPQRSGPLRSANLPTYAQKPQRITPQYQTTPQSILSSPVAITPRPLPPATTYRPQLIQATPKPHPQLLYSTTLPSSPSPTPLHAYQSTQRPGHIDFAAEFAKFQRENAISSTPKTQSKTSEPVSISGNPIYSTQLVYDPSSGQYNTQLFQSLPSKGELNLNQRLQPFVAQPSPRPFQPSPSLGSSSAPLYRHQIQHESPSLRNPQELYQRQQAESLYQNSAQLFAQQQQLQQSQLQRDRAAARAQAQKLGLLGASPSTPQPHFYYVTPQRGESSGQIDAFLKGHGIQF